MDLTLNSRFVGHVYIIQCTGRVVLGPEVTALETALDKGAAHGFNQFVLGLAELSRLDSIALGLIVRFAERLRKRGGDIRVAAPPPSLVKVLELTQLSKAMHSFPNEDEAILSFLCQPPPGDDAARQKHGPRVLFVDDSADLCVFVRTVLRQHGFDVHSSCLLRDARMLVQVDTVDYILAGPGTPQRSAETVLSTLKPLAPKAIPLRLPDDFKIRDAQEATASLLRLFKLQPHA